MSLMTLPSGFHRSSNKPIEGRSRRPLLARQSAQIAIGLLAAVVLPAVVRWPDTVWQFSAGSLNNALVATGVALLTGYYLTRRLAAFPGLEVFSFIAPAFSITYGLMAAELLLARHNYSRFQVLASFLIAIGFYYYAFIIEQRTKRVRFAVVPYGNITPIRELPRVSCEIWPSPDNLPVGFDGLVVDLRAKMSSEWEAFLARCTLSGIPVYHSKRIQESLTGRVDIEHLSENMLGSVVPTSIYTHVKVALDFLLGLLVLPVIAIICAVAAVLIKLDSPGPVFFVQKRVGYRGRSFRIYKLRTMRTDIAGKQYTEGDDPRVTRVGTFLRKYRIDELPQVLNILKGEMSWIGPRPESQHLSEWYQGEIAFYLYRHIVRPGITGWAQVNQGNVARPEMVKYKLHFDFYYIKHFSPWLDLVITAQTIRTVLTGFGSV